MKKGKTKGRKRTIVAVHKHAVYVKFLHGNLKPPRVKKLSTLLITSKHWKGAFHGENRSFCWRVKRENFLSAFSISANSTFATNHWNTRKLFTVRSLEGREVKKKFLNSSFNFLFDLNDSTWRYLVRKAFTSHSKTVFLLI